MKLVINHIDKIEGHGSLIAELEKGHVDKVRFMTLEGARLTESLLVGRPYSDPAIITPRICGVCPIIHNITALRGVEDAMGVKVKKDVVLLRKLMLCCQMIDSHALHLIFLSLGDFLNSRNDIRLVKEHPKEAAVTLRVKDFAIRLSKVIAGRTVHPLASQVGGFKRTPDRAMLKQFLAEADGILEDALAIAEIFRGLPYPKLDIENEFVALVHPKEYAYYDGKMATLHKAAMPIKKFVQGIEEYNRPLERVKHTRLQGKSYMVGALARLNLSNKKLHPQAQKFLKKCHLKFPVHNTFYNILAQAIELVHFVEETKLLLKEYLATKEHDMNYPFAVKAGKGFGASEAPRGTLFHYYEIDKNGTVKGCNLITPTAQLTENIEQDMAVYLRDSNAAEMTSDQRRQAARKLIRAYDPCMTCATH